MSLPDCFSSLTDPRRSVGMRTTLPQILSMTFIGYLCGSTGYRPLTRFCKAYAETFTEALSLRHPVPSHVTFRTVLQGLDQQALIEAFNSWAKDFVELSPSDWVSSDGKSLNSTVSNCHKSSQDFQAVVSLFAEQKGLVYAIEQYRNKSKETAETDIVRFLIDKLQGMGITLTVDALHTQKKRLKPL
jgi:hypothetical protein